LLFRDAQGIKTIKLKNTKTKLPLGQSSESSQQSPRSPQSTVHWQIKSGSKKVGQDSLKVRQDPKVQYSATVSHSAQVVITPGSQWPLSLLHPHVSPHSHGSLVRKQPLSQKKIETDWWKKDNVFKKVYYFRK
jgi:hypothetical protein